MSAITSFQLDVDDAELDDLRSRLRRTRWPDAETVPDWSQGVPLAYLQDLCGYWADGYQWRRVERELNDIGQFRTEVDGVGIHFLHSRSPHDGAVDLGSELANVIELTLDAAPLITVSPVGA